MDEKREIFESCRTLLDAQLGEPERSHNSLIDAYGYKYGLLDIEIQTDYDNHLALLIEASGHLYIYGGDYMPNLADWSRWQSKTLSICEEIVNCNFVLLTERYRNKKYLGGHLTVMQKNGGKIKLQDINSSFMKLLSNKQTKRFKYT